MSADPSLKRKSALVRHRNVLSRAERIERLKEEERWEEGDSLLGLPKVANRKVSIGKKEAKAKVEGEVPAAVGTGQAAAVQPAGTGKAAAPAGKTAAPAGKTAAAPSKAAGSKSSGQGKPGGGGRR